MFCDNCVTDNGDVRAVSVEGMEINGLLCVDCVTGLFTIGLGGN